MKNHLAMALLVGGLASPAAAQGEPILRLQCAWSSTLDTATMTSSATSGSKLITVETMDGRSGRLKKEGLGAEFVANLTEERIEAETAYQIDQLKMRERITINRFTGQIENWVTIGKAQLVHYGICKPLPSRLF